MTQQDTQLESALAGARTQQGTTVLELSMQSPVLLVLLRHQGCPFCREALSDIASQRSAIESRGLRIVLVHQSTDAAAEAFFKRYNLHKALRVSDPERSLYRALGLKRSNALQYLGPKVLWRLITTALRGHCVGKKIGDKLQMPGVFAVHRGQIIREFRHRTQADRPNYDELAASCALDLKAP